MSLQENIIYSVKPFKRLFHRGKMMKTFDYINYLYSVKDYNGIQQIALELSALPPSWNASYHKHIELIHYCEYLLDPSTSTSKTQIKLNMAHELGRAIADRLQIDSK